MQMSYVHFTSMQTLAGTSSDPVGILTLIIVVALSVLSPVLAAPATAWNAEAYADVDDPLTSLLETVLLASIGWPPCHSKCTMTTRTETDSKLYRRVPAAGVFHPPLA